jgi:hypothetical protein
MIVVAAKRGDTDQQHLHCYFFEARVWDYTKELVLKFGSGVVVFDLDSTIIFEGREVRNGWGRFCEKVFRNTAAEGGEHTSFKIYLCTRTTGDPQLMWDRELAPKSGVKGAPALTLSGIQHYRWVRGQRWERKQLTDVLTVHMVERHCVVIFDDKGLELEIASGAVANPGAILKDNWHPDCADSLFKVLPFNGYLKPDHPPPLTPWRDTRDQVRTEDCALMNHGTWLKDSQKLFVKQLGDVGCRVLASAEELTTELRTLDSFMSARVSPMGVRASATKHTAEWYSNYHRLYACRSRTMRSTLLATSQRPHSTSIGPDKKTPIRRCSISRSSGESGDLLVDILRCMP